MCLCRWSSDVRKSNTRTPHVEFTKRRSCSTLLDFSDARPR
jgi:hypothetical protein